MRPLARVLIALAFPAGAALSGCAGNGSSAAPAVPGGAKSSARVRTFDFLARSGVAPQLLSLLHPGRAGSQLAKAGKPPKALAVTDDGNQAVEVLNSSYVVASTITAGMD